MVARATRAAFLVAATSAACSLTTSFDGLSGGAPDTGADGPSNADARDEPSVADASTEPSHDAPTDDGPPPQNLVPNGGFDMSCDPWGTYNSTLASDSRGHTGTGCRVCLTSGTQGFSIDSSTIGPKNPPVGTRYHGEMWVRAVPNAPIAVNVVVRTFDEPPFTQKEQAGSAIVTLGDTWQLLATDLTVNRPAGFVDIYAYSAATAANSCFLADDASLTVVP